MYVAKLEDAGDKEEFGSKASMLSYMQRSGIPVPKAFVISAKVMELFISRNELEDRIRSVSKTTDRGLAGLRTIEKNTRELFLNALIPTEIKKAVLSAYKQLSLPDEVRRADVAALDLIRAGRGQERVALRSSVVRAPGNSFAGVAGAFLNVAGEDELWRYIKLCWASLFYPYSLLYRERRGVEDMPSMAIVVQRMVDSEKSGSMLTNFGNDKLLVEGTWGLGNAVSSGIVTPDEYLLHKNGALIEKNISKKLWMYVRNPMIGKTEKEHVPGSKMDAQVLTDSELRKLTELAERIQTSQSGQNVIDWCIGRNRVFILDAKPDNYEIGMGEESSGDLLVSGRCASRGSVSGKVKVFEGGDANHFGEGGILVSENPILPIILSFPGVSGYVTNEGGRLCNFSILARELNVPALTATQNAKSILHEGSDVNLLAEQGRVIAAPVEVAPQTQQTTTDGFGLPIQQENVQNLPPFQQSAQEEFNPHVQQDTAPPAQQPPKEEFGPPVQQESNEPYQQPAQQEPARDFPFPFESAPSEQSAQTPPEPVSGTKIFAKVSGGVMGRVEGVDGFIVSKGPEDRSMVAGAGQGIESIRSLGGGPVWMRSMGENDFPATLETVRGLLDSGTSGIGIIIPVTRGVNDIKRWRHQIPASARIGIEIKTPAMAVSAGSFIKDGVAMVDIDLKSMVQLGMGLARPDRELHPGVLDMITGVIDTCKGSGAKVCISADQELLTDENVESLVRRGVDAFCVEPAMVGGIRNALAMAERNIMLANGSESNEATGQEQAPAPGPFDPGQSDDFSPSSSFSLL